MSNTWCNMKMTHCHSETEDVPTSEGNSSLKSTDEALIVLDVVMGTEIRGVKFRMVSFVNR